LSKTSYKFNLDKSLAFYFIDILTAVYTVEDSELKVK